MTARSVAIVPMRHSSERVKGKNYRRFAGKPLYHHIVNALLQCDTLAAIVIDTDSPVIMEDAAVHFPQVKVLERPAHLRSDETPMNDVLLNTILQVEADFYLQTHSTNPLLKPTTIEHALQRFLQHYPAYDSLFGVTRWNTRFWDGLARPMNHNPAILLRTQDLPPLFEENSNLYIFTREILQSQHNRIGQRPLLFEIDRLEAWDIDEEADFKIAELLHLSSQEPGSPR